jgi:hypothetical protein
VCGALLALPAFADGNGAGNHCNGNDTGAPGQGGNHLPCDTPPATLPPPPAPAPPAPPAADPPVPVPVPGATPGVPVVLPPDITPPPVVVTEVKGEVAVQLISNTLRRAFVAGEGLHLAGDAPGGCDPRLRVDGKAVGPIAVGSGGGFDLDVPTSDLAAGRHVAEVFCSTSSATLRRTVFWVAAPQSSSNLFVVGLTSLLVLCALAWVCLRSLAGSTVTASAVAAPGAASS